MEIEMLSKRNKRVRQDKEKLLEHLEVTNQWVINFMEELEKSGISYELFDLEGYNLSRYAEELENWVDMNKRLINKFDE